RQFCTFYLGDQYLGLDVLRVQEIIRYQEMTHVPLAHAVVRGLINLRGQIVTAIDLRRRLDLPDRPQGQLPVNVVVQTDEGAVSPLGGERGGVGGAPARFSEPPREARRAPPRVLISGPYRRGGQLLLALHPAGAVPPPAGPRKNTPATG